MNNRDISSRFSPSCGAMFNYSFFYCLFRNLYYSGTGGAVSIQGSGNSVFVRSFFDNITSTSMGGAVYITGNANINNDMCCFSDCKTSHYGQTIFNEAKSNGIHYFCDNSIQRCSKDGTGFRRVVYFVNGSVVCNNNNLSFCLISSDDAIDFKYTKSSILSYSTFFRNSLTLLIEAWDSNFSINSNNMINNSEPSTVYGLFYSGTQSKMFIYDTIIKYNSFNKFGTGSGSITLYYCHFFLNKFSTSNDILEPTSIPINHIDNQQCLIDIIALRATNNQRSSFRYTVFLYYMFLDNFLLM